MLVEILHVQHFKLAPQQGLQNITSIRPSNNIKTFVKSLYFVTVPE